MILTKRSLKTVPYYGCLIVFSICMAGCSAGHKAFNPAKKYAPQQLREDYTLFRKILEESHPSLYWFTPKDSMDYYFQQGYREIKDSMTERGFKTLLTYVTTKIRCGHTSVKYSRAYSHYLDTARNSVFPLSFKVWPDTAVITANLIRNDSTLTSGTIITRINNMPVPFLIDTFLNYLPGDGYAITGRYQSLSNFGVFGTLYHDLFGLPKQITVDYINPYGLESKTIVPLYNPLKDTMRRHIDSVEKQQPRPSKKEIRDRKLLFARNVQVDTALHSAYMSLNTFSGGNHLKGFFHHTFRALQRLQIPNLVIDVRANGGGDASNSTLITRYLIDHPFKIADSLYATRRSSHYSRYIKMQKLYWLMMLFVTRKHADGNFHFGYFERHYFKPKTKYHYNGQIYILTGGNSFSAATLFAEALKGQKNVTILGEETGGGAYGNTAWMIPDVTLPNTKIRFRLPKFRLVMNKDLEKDGRGVMPDIRVSPTVQDIRDGVDPKIRAMKNLIIEHNQAMGQ